MQNVFRACVWAASKAPAQCFVFKILDSNVLQNPDLKLCMSNFSPPIVALSDFYRCVFNRGM